VLHPDAAGIDVGASELFVEVPADRDPERGHAEISDNVLQHIVTHLGMTPTCGSRCSFGVGRKARARSPKQQFTVVNSGPATGPRR